jgi:uncharacterized membrane protein YecN with MAPEG domain
MLLITGFTTAILAIYLIFLSILTIRARRRFKVSLADNGELDLIKFIRAQGNLTEFAPIFLILLLLVEINHLLPVFWLWMIVLIFILGRCLHSVSLILVEPKTFNLRIFAMTCTFSSILLLACVLLINFIQKL